MRRRVRKTETQNDAAALARIRFRPCRVKDVAEVIRFWNQFGAAHSLKDESAAVRRRLKRDRGLFVLAWDGGRLVGTIMAGWDGWRASMARLAVDPQYRRIGLARSLVGRVEWELRSLGARRIGAIVLKNNRGGRAYWSNAGYELDREDVRYVKDLTASLKREQPRSARSRPARRPLTQTRDWTSRLQTDCC
jgi:ribosomal protein S18 acetylase RimI-like enzyme